MIVNHDLRPRTLSSNGRDPYCKFITEKRICQMKIIFKKKNGDIAIMTVVEGADRKEAIQKFLDAHPKEYVDYYDYKGELPEDREFRDAWMLKDNKIIVAHNKAKQIHLERIRQARNAELERLDKEQLRYMLDESMLKDIEEQKKELRELPSKVNSLDWPDGLSKLWR